MLYMFCEYLLVVIASTIISCLACIVIYMHVCTNIYAGTYLIFGFHITPSDGELSALQLTCSSCWNFDFDDNICDADALEFYFKNLMMSSKCSRLLKDIGYFCVFFIDC